MAGHSSRALVDPFAQRLLSTDLPGLTRAQRDEVSAFAVRRVDGLPSALRIGVTLIAAPMRLIVAVPGSGRIVSWLIRHPLPGVGEYVRMIRSLAYTYIWERWPDASTNGTVTAAGDSR